ncbi:MAG: tetratricopeptide repeat protein, partial [Bacteroidetes bacterium]|nr:tetratricopeptide repeat protein [Bacteroidota bacterium]
MFFIRTYFFICFFVLSIKQNAQNIDSLKVLLNTTKNDTVKAKTCASLATYYSNSDLKLSLKYTYNGINLSKKNKLNSLLSNLYCSLGQAYQADNSDSSIYYLLKAKNIALKYANSKKDLAQIYLVMGNAYDVMADNENALNYYMKSLKLFDSIQEIRGSASANMGIGNVFDRLKKYKKSIEYYEKAVDGYKKGNLIYLSWALENLGGAYQNIGELEKAKKIHKEALRLKLENKDVYGTLESYNSIGSILMKEGNPTEALNYFMKALDTEHKNNFEEETFATSYNLIADLLLKTKKHSIAKKYIDSLQIISNKNNKNLALKLKLFSLNSRYYEIIGDFKKSMNYNTYYFNLKDSIYNKETEKQIADADAKYSNEKKQKDIELLQKEKKLNLVELEKKQSQRNVFVIGFIAVLILLLFIFRSLSAQRKANKIISHQKVEVEQQKTIVEQQKHVIEERHKEITDSINYAERIQRSFLATKEMLDSNLNRHSKSNGYTTPNSHAKLVSASEQIPKQIRNNDNDYFIFFKPKDVVSGDFYWAASTSSATTINKQIKPNVEPVETHDLFYLA